MIWCKVRNRGGESLRLDHDGAKVKTPKASEKQGERDQRIK